MDTAKVGRPRYEIGGQCRKGHALTVSTLGYQPSNDRRYCKICASAVNRRQYERAKERARCR